LDAATGAHIWNYTTDDVVDSSPAVADDKVYVGSHDGKVHCIDAATGVHMWNYTAYEHVCSSPAVADGKVYVGSEDHKVYCLDAATGAHIWNYTTDDVVDSSPAVADGKVYVGSDDHKVYCLDAATGAHIWNYTTDDVVCSSPAVADGKVYVGSRDGRVYAFGDVLLTFVWPSDSAGNSKFAFNMSDDVYVKGQELPTDTDITIYLIPDGLDALPTNAVANASSTTNSTGGFPVTLVWPQPLTLGEYDIWVDVNKNGVFDEGDVWNNQSIGIHSLNVIPEFPTWTSIILISIMLVVAVAIYKRRIPLTPIS
jgi:hypothetical protein